MSDLRQGVTGPVHDVLDMVDELRTRTRDFTPAERIVLAKGAFARVMNIPDRHGSIDWRPHAIEAAACLALAVEALDAIGAEPVE